MQVKITTSVDSFLKTSFEATQDLHKKTFSDVLEDAIRQVLGEVSPLESVKMMISHREQELSELRARAAEIEVLQAQQKQIAHAAVPEEDIDLWTEKREELFEIGRGTLISQLQRKQQPAWKNIHMRYGFDTPKEMEMFVRKEAIKRRLI